MLVDTIYDLILSVILFHILHIISGDICGTQHEIMKKYLSVTDTLST